MHIINYIVLILAEELMLVYNRRIYMQYTIFTKYCKQSMFIIYINLTVVAYRIIMIIIKKIIYFIVLFMAINILY